MTCFLIKYRLVSQPVAYQLIMIIFFSYRIRAAVQTDDLDLLQDLLTRQRSYSHEDLSAALCLAAELGRDECVEVLLRHNALPNIHDGSGFTPLIIAAKFGNCGVLRFVRLRSSL